jgi:hypothetical protein
MSLLEKASGGKKPKDLPSQAGTSLFKRAMAASRTEVSPLRYPVAEAAPFEAPEAPPAPAASALPAFPGAEALDELKASLASLPPSQDSILAAWSLLASRLPLQAVSLFLPEGDFLSRAAQLGFPAGAEAEIPLSIAPASDGDLLGEEARALVATSLGVGLGMGMRGTAMRAQSGPVGLWVYHDDSLEAAPEEIRSRLSDLLADLAGSSHPLSMASSVEDPASLVISRMARYPFATALRFDLPPAYCERAAFRGIQARTIRSALASAAERILEQTGVVAPYGEASIACVLGSSSRCDPELALFQFTKTLRRGLPFLAAESFPTGSAQGFDLSSDRAAEGLSSFLSD